MDVRGCLREAQALAQVDHEDAELERAVEEAAGWAGQFVTEFADYQIGTLPWLKK